MYSTVFFIDGNPYGYKLVRTAYDAISIQPGGSLQGNNQLPHLRACWLQDRWQVDGTDNQSLIDQVVEELTKNHGLLEQDFKAAP